MSVVQNPLESFNTADDKTYLDPTSGIFPKINLDTLSLFFKSQENIQVNRLEFELKFEEGSKEDFFENVADLRFYFIGDDGEDINHAGITKYFFFQTTILPDVAYLSSNFSGANIMRANKDDNTLTFSCVPTFFGQLIETEDLEVDNLLIMPSDLNSPNFSVFDRSTSMKIKLYYTLPE